MEEDRPLRQRRFERIMIVRADRAYIDRSEPTAAEVRGLAEPDRGIANIGMVGIIDERDPSIAPQRRKALVKPGLQPGDAGAACFRSVRHGVSFGSSAPTGEYGRGLCRDMV